MTKVQMDLIIKKTLVVFNVNVYFRKSIFYKNEEKRKLWWI